MRIFILVNWAKMHLQSLHCEKVVEITRFPVLKHSPFFTPILVENLYHIHKIIWKNVDLFINRSIDLQLEQLQKSHVTKQFHLTSRLKKYMMK